MSSTSTDHRPNTLADELEHVRLRHRRARMELVVGELRRRAAERRRQDGAVPRPLGLAIEGFEQELAELRARMSPEVANVV